MLEHEETPEFYSIWITSITKACKANEQAFIFREEDDDVPVIAITMPAALFIGLTIAYFFHGLLPHEAAMQFWKHLSTVSSHMFNHAFPDLGRIMYMLILRLFTTPSQGEMQPHVTLPPQPPTNHSNLPVSPYYPYHRHMDVQEATVFSPETVLGLLINNTQFQQTFTTLLLTQVAGSLPGCSAVATNAIKFYKKLALTRVILRAICGYRGKN
jgi:hypothetical protein